MAGEHPSDLASSAPDPHPRRWRVGTTRILPALGKICCMLVALELSCRIAEFALDRLRNIKYEPMPRLGLSKSQRDVITRMLDDTSAYYTHHPDYGWSIKPDGAHGLYRANAAGLRGDHEYERQAPAGVVRIACFGDSFTHGDDVPNTNVWTALLEQAAPNLEVLNFGVGGFGVDQAYLRFTREGGTYAPDIVLIGFMTRNIERHVNVFRPFVRATTGMPLAKPRFRIEDGKLTLQPNLLRDADDYRELLKNPRESIKKLRQHDYHARHAYHKSSWDVLSTARLAKLARASVLKSRSIMRRGIFDRDAEPYDVTLLLLEQFAEDVRRTGAQPLIVLFPDGTDIKTDRLGQTMPYAPLREDLLARGYPVIDLLDAFQSVAGTVPVRKLCDGHYSRYGNELVKNHILGNLVDRGLLPAPVAEVAVAPTGSPQAL